MRLWLQWGLPYSLDHVQSAQAFMLSVLGCNRALHHGTAARRLASVPIPLTAVRIRLIFKVNANQIR